MAKVKARKMLKTNNVLVLVIVVVAIVGLVKVVFDNRNNSEGFSNLYLAQPTKSVDSEREMKFGNKWMAQPSKCFNCEKDLLRRNEDPQKGQPSKCFSCENQMASNRVYAKGGATLGRLE